MDSNAQENHLPFLLIQQFVFVAVHSFQFDDSVVRVIQSH